jgi:hypothetical protein
MLLVDADVATCNWLNYVDKTTSETIQRNYHQINDEDLYETKTKFSIGPILYFTWWIRKQM